VGADVLRRLVAANPFVGRFYPNFHATDPSSASVRRIRLVSGVKAAVERLAALPSFAVESICRRAYYAYLKRQASTWRSPEQVRLQDDCLKLHTRSHRQSVLERFDRVVRDALQTP
jgi:hypothetical protein